MPKGYYKGTNIPVRKGKTISEEHKDAIRNWNKNRTPSWLGKHHTEEYKQKMSESCKKANNGRWMKGKKLAPETKMKISIAERGEKHYNWKGGINPINDTIRKSKEYRDWRTSVFHRDNFICQMCGEKGHEIRAHHIIPFSISTKVRFSETNGVTLCKSCHTEADARNREIFKAIRGIENGIQTN